MADPSPRTFNANTAREPVRGITEAQFRLWAAMKADQIIEISRFEFVEVQSATLRDRETTSTYLGRTMHAVLHINRRFAPPRAHLDDRLTNSFHVSELNEMRGTVPDYRQQSFVAFKRMIVDRIEQSYAEFDPRSPYYVPLLRGRTAQATIYDEIWDNNLTSAAFTTASIASTAASTTPAVNTTLTAQLLRRQMEELSLIRIMENPYLNGAYISNGSINGRNISIPSFDWNDMTTDGVHPGVTPSDRTMSWARSIGKSSFLKEMWEQKIPKQPPESTGPQQLDLFD